jgi:hypothetical protein
MLRFTALALIALLTSFTAMADDEPLETRDQNVRVSCASVHMADPFIQVSGVLRVRDFFGTNSTGILRVSTGSMNTFQVRVAGQYHLMGETPIIALRADDSNSGIWEIYIEARDGGMTRGSYVSFTNGDFRRMGCRILQ